MRGDLQDRPVRPAAVSVVLLGTFFEEHLATELVEDDGVHDWRMATFFRRDQAGWVRAGSSGQRGQARSAKEKPRVTRVKDSTRRIAEEGRETHEIKGENLPAKGEPPAAAAVAVRATLDPRPHPPQRGGREGRSKSCQH